MHKCASRRNKISDSACDIKDDRVCVLTFLINPNYDTIGYCVS